VEKGKPAELDLKQLAPAEQSLRRKTHETIAKVSDDYGRRLTFNTAIAAVMELLNEINKHADNDSVQAVAVEREALQAAVLTLAPIVPHICQELWQVLGHDAPVMDAPWPTHDPQALTRDSIEMVVQVNGKLRGKIEIPVGMDKASIQAEALGNENAQRFIDGKEVVKVIVVPNKLINIVVRG
jgi:leucyl-tRNA synthetase